MSRLVEGIRTLIKEVCCGNNASHKVFCVANRKTTPVQRCRRRRVLRTDVRRSFAERGLGKRGERRA